MKLLSGEYVIISDLGLINLVGGIIYKTAQDLHFGTKEDKKEARKFMRSEWFEDLVSGGNIDPNRVRWLLKHRRTVIRKNYE